MTAIFTHWLTLCITLAFSELFSGTGNLHAQVAKPQQIAPTVYAYTRLQSEAGVLLHAHAHNQVRCGGEGGFPITGDIAFAADEETRLWMYEFTGEEPPFNGRYFISAGELAAVPRYAALPRLTEFTRGRAYYVMTERDLFFQCGKGLSTAPDGPVCGNGTREPGEECDGDGCGRGMCSDECICGPSGGPLCGNGMQDDGEECDDANRTDHDECSNDCKAPVCGDGITENILGKGAMRRTINEIAAFLAEGKSSGLLDIDGNRLPEGATDGVIIVRYLKGTRGWQLVNKATAQNAKRTDPDAIATYLTEISPQLDADGNGIVTVENDGILVLRSLNNYTGKDFLGEECDDGNAENNDGCSSLCRTCPILTPPACPSGTLLGGGEEKSTGCPRPQVCCGDGACTGIEAPTLCPQDCSEPVCGNGQVERGETCDSSPCPDGGICTAQCTCPLVASKPVCGNGIQENGEECDDGNSANGDECSALCRVEFCGDGEAQEAQNETCDNGSTCSQNPSIACSTDADCNACIRIPGTTARRCGGDPYGTFCKNDSDCSSLHNTCQYSAETDQGCSASCERLAPACGNGRIEGEEACDDGNATSGDGCSLHCAIESKWHCFGRPSACTTIQPVNRMHGSAPSPISLLEARREGENLLLRYTKDFDACAVIETSRGTLPTTTPFLCKRGKNITATIPLASTLFRSMLAPGTLLRLCHTTQDGVCSNAGAVEDIQPVSAFPQLLPVLSAFLLSFFP